MENVTEYFTIFNHTFKITDVTICCFTFFLVLISLMQWRWMVKGIKDSRAVNRAFVFIECIKYTSHIDMRSKKIFWRFVPVWVNTGNTPTRCLRINVNFDLRDTSLPDDFLYPQKGQNVPTLIGPKASIQGSHIDIPGDVLLQVQSGSKYLYIWGSATYCDVFDGSKKHVTKFCRAVRNITGDPMQSFNSSNNIVGMTFAHHTQHNCMDDDCKLTK